MTESLYFVPNIELGFIEIEGYLLSISPIEYGA
jgi:hypothetical protein